MNDSLEKCILELQKPEKERNIEIIVKYIKTLKGYINILKFSEEEFETNLIESAKILKYSDKEKNEIVVEEGDKGDSFYLLLKGSCVFLVSKLTTYEMTKEEYMFHLFKLRKNNSNELLRQCLLYNNLSFPIDESFDVLIKNIVNKKTKGGEFLDNENIINGAKELYNYLKKNTTNKTKIKSIEEYIERNKVILKEEKNLTIEEKEKLKKEKKAVQIPNFIIIGKCGKGDTFGELALEKSGGKRKATVITFEESHFAIIYRNEFNNLLKNAVEKAKKKFFSVIVSYTIFSHISNYTLEKKYYKLFALKKFEKGNNLIEQNENGDKSYFIINGDFEIYTNRNIVEINDLIIYYKNYIRKYGKKNDYKLYNPYIEIRENEDLTLNKKFKSDEENKILFEKRLLKLSIFQNRDIIGLNDLMIPLNNSISVSKSLVFCKSLTHNSQVYSIDKNQLFFILDHEERVSELIIEYEINKMKMLIQRLNIHKERIYNLTKKIDFDLSEKSKNISISLNHSNRKNRFSNLEDNIIVENNQIKNYIYRIEKEKEYKEKLLESTKKKNKFDSGKKKMLLPKIKINNQSVKKGNLNNTSSRLLTTYNSNDTFYNYYREGLFHRNLYETIFKDYAFNYNKNNDKLFKTTTNNKNKPGVYDFLILDKFNSTYLTALREIKNRKNY